MLRPKGVEFYLTVPRLWEPAVMKQVAVVWPRAGVTEMDRDPLLDVVRWVQPGRGVTKTGATVTARLGLKNHYMFGFKLRSNFLPSLLEVTRMLQPGEQAVIQLLLTPAPPDWWRQAAEAYEEFKKGKMPQRLRVNPENIAEMAATCIAAVTMEVVNITTELISGKPSDLSVDGPSKALALRERPATGTGVAEKLKADALDVTVHAGVTAATEQAAQSVMRAVELAFRSLEGDNQIMVESHTGKGGWQRLLGRTPGWEKALNRDYMTLAETALLVQLPQGDAQDEFGLDGGQPETPNLPASVLNPGLMMGWATWRGSKFPVYLPNGNRDETCLPRVVIGGMGCGKTKGFGSNLAVEAVLAGDHVVIIDPAAGEMGDEIAAMLPAHQVKRIRFGDLLNLIALDWREVRHGADQRKARSRLAQQLIAFVDAATDEAGAQTVRYMRSAAKVVPSGRLSEVVRLMTEPDYLKAQLDTMPERERATWDTYLKASDARRAQIAGPVLNRLDVILGDDYLAECMDAEEGLDFVELLDSDIPTCIVLDIPKGDLGPEVLDIIAALVSTKLELAMTMRKTWQERVVRVIQDEPHQYMRSARTWRSVVVESRKWRFGYVWMFHSWEQIPHELAEIIKAAGPHYHLYQSSPATFQALRHEIAPWTVEEAIRIPRFHALHVLRADNRTLPPFLAQMSPPPTVRRANERRAATVAKKKEAASDESV